MKRLATTTIMVLNLLMVSAQGYVVEDDIYYTKKTTENPIVVAKKSQQAAESRSTEVFDTSFSSSDYKGSSRSTDEYNRQNLGDMTLGQLDSLSVALEKNKESGYYLDEFNGTQEDAEYAARIHRFHNPRYTVFVGDPAYNDIYFLNSWDWNVYVDGSYAFVTPTWNNPFYWNYRWAPYSYSSHYWRWGGMHSPWAWNSHWGWDPWRYDPWGYYGHHNYYNSYHHYNPYWSGYRPSYARSGRNYDNGRRSTYQSEGRGSARYNSDGSRSGRGSRYTTVAPSSGSSSSSSGGRYYRGSSSSSSSETRSNGVYRGSSSYESSPSRSSNYNSSTPSSSSSSGNSYRSSSSGSSRSYSGGSGGGGYVNSRGSRR